VSDNPTGPGGPGFFDRLRAALRGVDPSQVADDASQAAGDLADDADHGIAGAIKRLRRRGKKPAGKKPAASGGGGIKGRIEELRRQREREEQQARRRDREQPKATPPARPAPPATGRGGLSRAIEERHADLLLSGTPLAGAPWILTGPNNDWLILGNAGLVEANPDRTGLNAGMQALIDWIGGWKGGNDWAGSGHEYSALAVLNWREPANWLWRSYSQSNNKASTLLSA
jgi:hypothetical protein